MEDKEIGYIKEKLQTGRPIQHIEIKQLVETIEQQQAEIKLLKQDRSEFDMYIESQARKID